MAKKICSVCKEVELHRDNTSGICRICKRKGARPGKVDGKSLAAGERPEATAKAAPKASKAAKKTGQPVMFERTDKEPKKPFVGLNLLVIEAIGRGKKSVADIAAHFEGSPAFKDSSKQDPAHAARWHAWHLAKKGFLKKQRAGA